METNNRRELEIEEYKGKNGLVVQAAGLFNGCAFGALSYRPVRNTIEDFPDLVEIIKEDPILGVSVGLGLILESFFVLMAFDGAYDVYKGTHHGLILESLKGAARIVDYVGERRNRSY